MQTPQQALQEVESEIQAATAHMRRRCPELDEARARAAALGANPELKAKLQRLNAMVRVAAELYFAFR